MKSASSRAKYFYDYDKKKWGKDFTQLTYNTCQLQLMEFRFPNFLTQFRDFY